MVLISLKTFPWDFLSLKKSMTNTHIHLAGPHASCQSTKNIKPQLLCCCFTPFLRFVHFCVSFHGPLVQLSAQDWVWRRPSMEEASRKQPLSNGRGRQSRAGAQASPWAPMQPHWSRRRGPSPVITLRSFLVSARLVREKCEIWRL